MIAVATQAIPEEGPYRVMVVDDSAVVRGIVKRWLEADPSMSVVATCGDGAQALRKAETTHCDVIVLDIEMPHMDGLAALPALLKACARRARHHVVHAHAPQRRDFAQGAVARRLGLCRQASGAARRS